MTYGKSVTLSRSASYQRGRNTVSLKTEKAELGPVSNIIIVLLIISLLGLVYLTQVTKTNSLGYELNELTTQRQQLDQEYASLELEEAKLKSLERVKNSDIAKAMQDTKPAAYISN